jgi:hypothetical protein
MRKAQLPVLSAFIGVHRRPIFGFDFSRWARRKHIWPPMNADNTKLRSVGPSRVAGISTSVSRARMGQSISISVILFQRPERLEFLARKLRLPLFRVKLGKVVMRGLPIGSKSDRFFEFVHRAVRPVFI